MPNSWTDGAKTAEYLTRADTLPHRGEGEGVLVRDLGPALPGRVLDLGCGDGRLTALVLAAYPESTATCIDMSQPMLEAARERFADDDRVTLGTHDFENELPSTARTTRSSRRWPSTTSPMTASAPCTQRSLRSSAPGGVFAQPRDRQEPDQSTP